MLAVAQRKFIVSTLLCFLDTSLDGLEQGTGERRMKDRRQGVLVPLKADFLKLWERNSTY